MCILLYRRFWNLKCRSDFTTSPKTKESKKMQKAIDHCRRNPLKPVLIHYHYCLICSLFHLASKLGLSGIHLTVKGPFTWLLYVCSVLRLVLVTWRIYLPPFFVVCRIWYLLDAPQYNKTNKMISAPSEDSEQTCDSQQNDKCAQWRLRTYNATVCMLSV